MVNGYGALHHIPLGYCHIALCCMVLCGIAWYSMIFLYIDIVEVIPSVWINEFLLLSCVSIFLLSFFVIIIFIITTIIIIITTIFSSVSNFLLPFLPSSADRSSQLWLDIFRIGFALTIDRYTFFYCNLLFLSRWHLGDAISMILIKVPNIFMIAIVYM